LTLDLWQLVNYVAHVQLAIRGRHRMRVDRVVMETIETVKRRTSIIDQRIRFLRHFLRSKTLL